MIRPRKAIKTARAGIPAVAAILVLGTCSRDALDPSGTFPTPLAAVSSHTVITATLLTVGTNTVNQRVYTTAAVAPAPNTLITVAVLGHSSVGTPPIPTLSGGGMAAWDVVATVLFDGTTPLRRLTVFRAMSAAPGSGPLTITSSVTLSHTQWIVSQWDGAETSGVNGSGAIVQTGSIRGDAVTGLTVPLAAFGNANNVAYGAFGVNRNVAVITPGAGFTEIAEQPSGEGTPGDLQVEGRINDNTIDATWPTSLNGGALGIEIKAAASGVDALQSTVSAVPSAIQAGGGTSTITVTVRDANGDPISGATVELSATGIGNTLSAPGETDASGVYTGTLSSTVAEDKVVTATVTVAGVATALNQSATVTVTPQGAMAITATLLTVGTDVVNQRIYTTAPISPVANTLITVAVLGHSSLGTPPIPTLSGGGMAAWDVVATVTFDGTTPLRRLTVFRAMSAAPGSGPLTITSSLTLAHSQWIVSQWSGVETSGVNGSGAIVQTGSTRGDAVSGLTVPLTAFGDANNVAYGAFGVNRNLAVITPGAGFTEIAEQPSGEGTPGDLQVEGRIDDNTIDATWPTPLNGGALGIEIKAAASGSGSDVDPAQSTLEASPTTITPGGAGSTIEVTVRDAGGSPLSGVVVQLAATGTGNTLSPAGPTDLTGVYQGTLSSTKAEAKLVTATARLGTVTTALNATALVTVEPGPVSATQSSVSAEPASIQAGGQTATVTVMVKDAHDNPISGATVQLSATGIGNTLSVPGETDASGVYTGTLSSTVAEDKVVTATVTVAGVATALNQSATVTVTPQGATAITATLLTVGTNTVNQRVYTTAAVAPAPNTLITVAVLGHSSLGTPPIPTLSGGGMAAWDVVATVTFDGTTPLRRLTVFRAMSAAPGSGPLTITSSLTLAHSQWIVSQWSGVETSGVNGSGAIVQTGSIRGDAVSGLNVVLSTFGNANNVAYGAFGVNRNVAVITPGAGFTEIAEQPSGEGTPGDLQAEGRIDDNTIDATWPTPLNAGALGVEIKAAAASAGSVVLVGAGDIADCETSTDEATATLMDAIPGAVFTAGDNAYPDGTASNFANCYEPTWGRHKARTFPSPGNHDYETSGAAAYFAYFGDRAGPAGRGYYSYDLGDWHVISLNSEISMSVGSAQEQWLRAVLAANTKQCTLAYWHKPLFSSGFHGSLSESRPLWEALYEFDAEVVVVGHDHNYERFAPQTATGVADPVRGLRQFVVGTGGTDLRDLEATIANSEVRNSTTHGVLKLTLHGSGYEWEFIPVAGQTFTDSGSGSCH